MDAVRITDAPLSLEELGRVTRGAPVELSPAARARIAASRAVVDAALATGKPIYGLNTGLGHGKDTRLPDEELRRFQEMMVGAHAGGVGEPLPTELVRGLLAVRLNGMARGGSGASPAAAEILADMLNRGVHPVVPSGGSVGASDLAQMAAVALVAIGRGRAELAGEELPGVEALARAGLEPLVLGPKDGLTLMSANALSIAHGAAVVAVAEDAAAAAELVAVLSLEALGGNPSIVLPVVGAAKPFPGQVETCANMSALLAGSRLLDPDVPGSIQDPLSFRVAPQVNGAVREFVAAARRAVEVELNSMSDNPLVSVADGTMVHNGNFHPMVMALAFDALRPALAHSGQLASRRMSHLWGAFFAAGPPGGGPAPDGPPPRLFGLSLRYAAASLDAELRQLAGPATLDVSPLDLGVEDHATAAPLTVRRTGEALRLLLDVLAMEALLARDVIDARGGREGLGVGARAALASLDEALDAVAPEAPAAEALRTVRSRFPADVLEGARAAAAI